MKSKLELGPPTLTFKAALYLKIKMLAKFAIVLLGMVILCTIVWDLTAERFLYDCTDPIGFGFLAPGDWVHNQPGKPIMAVAKVVHGRDMSEPDTIKAGWSVTKLWCLWFALAGISLAVSFILSRKTWTWFSDAIIESKRQPPGAS